jgi:hypothetical protein
MDKLPQLNPELALAKRYAVALALKNLAAPRRRTTRPLPRDDVTALVAGAASLLNLKLDHAEFLILLTQETIDPLEDEALKFIRAEASDPHHRINWQAG